MNNIPNTYINDISLILPDIQPLGRILIGYSDILSFYLILWSTITILIVFISFMHINYASKTLKSKDNLVFPVNNMNYIKQFSLIPFISSFINISENPHGLGKMALGFLTLNLLLLWAIINIVGYFGSLYIIKYTNISDKYPKLIPILNYYEKYSTILIIVVLVILILFINISLLLYLLYVIYK